MINKKKIFEALSNVIDPDKKKDLVTLNSIKDITINKDFISIKIILSPPGFKLKEVIRRNCLTHLKKIDNSLIYDIKFSSNNEKIESKPVIKKFNTNNIKNIIAITSGKGGVGKSTISSNIAIGLSKIGAKVGLIDADIFGPSIPIMFNCENEQPTYKKVGEKNIIIPIEQYGIKLLSMGLLIPKEKAIIWRGPMASSAMKQLILDVDWGNLDYLIVDLPPGTSDIHITLSQNFSVSGSIIVTTPQKVSTIDAEKAIAMFNQENTKVPILGLIQNMSYFKTEEGKKHFIFGKNGGKEISKKMSIDMLGDIPIDSRIADCSDNGYPIILKNNDCSKLFKNICHNIKDKITKINSK